MPKAQPSDKLISIFESLSDLTVTLVADFLADSSCGGLRVATQLATLGLTVFPVGVAGEDAGGQSVVQTLHDLRVSTSGISRIKNYVTPAAGGDARIQEEHPVLVNLVENARKFVVGSDAMYVCDYGIGAASPRVVNFIKSNRCLQDKTLAGRSLHRIVDFEQLTAAVASVAELEDAIGIQIGDDMEKVTVASQGAVRELRLRAFLCVTPGKIVTVAAKQKPVRTALSTTGSAAEIDIMGAFFAAALASGAEARDAAELSARLAIYLAGHPPVKRVKREELIAFLGQAS